MAQRLMPFESAPPTREQSEPIAETVADVLRGHRHEPGGSQLDRQCNAVQTLADLDHCVQLGPVVIEVEGGAHCSRPFYEQLDSEGATTAAHRKRSNWPDVFGCDAETFARRCQDVDEFSVAEDRLNGRSCRVQDVLAVVEHDQQTLTGECAGDASTDV